MILSATKYLIYMLCVCVMFISACASSHQYFEALSDETLSLINEPLHTRIEVKQAQRVIQKRLWKKLKTSQVQSELRGFACLIFAQTLDPTTARGQKASSQYLCKKSRFPKDQSLPRLYDTVARQHDQLLWNDLQATQSWQQYARNCLDCQHAMQAKALGCLQQVDEIDILQSIEKAPLKDWWTRCHSELSPKIQALVKYRKWMLDSIENVPYPLAIDHLPSNYTQKLTRRSILGEAKRLEISILDGKKTQIFLSKHTKAPSEDPQWHAVWKNLSNRVDTRLMPCLEWGIDACNHVAQREEARLQAIYYVQHCQDCTHKPLIQKWLAQLPMQLIPRWHLDSTQISNAILTPHYFMIYSGTRLTRFNLQTAQSILTAQQEQNHDQVSIDQWSHFTQSKGDWWTGSPQGATYDLLASTSMSRSQVAPQLKPHQTFPYVWLHSAYQITALNVNTGQAQWSFNYPIKEDQVTHQCKQLVQVSNSLLACIGSNSIYFLTQSGMTVARSECPQDGCGLAYASQYPYLIVQNQLASHLHIYDLSDLYQFYTQIQQVSDEINRITLQTQILDLQQKIRSVQQQDHLLVISTDTKIQVYDMRQKKLRWSQEFKETLSSTPLLHAKQNGLYVLTSKTLQYYHVEKGLLLWQKPMKPKKLRTQFSTRRPNHMALQDQFLIVANVMTKQVSSYHQKTGQLIWQNQLNTTLPIMKEDAWLLQALPQQVILVSPSQGVLLAFQLSQGTLQWRWQGKRFKSLQLNTQWLLIQGDDYSSLYSIKTDPAAALQTAKSLEQESLKALATSKSRTRKKKSKSKIMQAPYVPLLPSRVHQDAYQSLVKITDQNTRLAQSCQFGHYTQCVTWAKAYIKTHQKSEHQKINLPMNIESGLAHACDWGEGHACLLLGHESISEQLSIKPMVDAASADQNQSVNFINTALHYYEKAKSLQQQEALFHLGSLYQKSAGIKINHQKARVYFQQACDLNMMKACSRLAWLYELGLGASSKPIAALKLYTLACKSGDSWACQQKNRLQKEKK